MGGVIVKRGAIVYVSITDITRLPRRRKKYEVVKDRNEEEGQHSQE